MYMIRLPRVISKLPVAPGSFVNEVTTNPSNSSSATMKLLKYYQLEMQWVHYIVKFPYQGLLRVYRSISYTLSRHNTEHEFRF